VLLNKKKHCKPYTK